jgi:hypothetical protein
VRLARLWRRTALTPGRARWQYAVCAAAACRTVLQMHANGGAPVRALMHTTATDLTLTTFTAEPERDAEQLRYRSSRWDESSLYD